MAGKVFFSVTMSLDGFIAAEGRMGDADWTAHPRAIDAPDLYDEQRFVIGGRSVRDRLLFVVHAVVEHERIRISSARKASRAQREAYEGHSSH